MRCLHSSLAAFRAGTSSRHVIHSTLTGGEVGGGEAKRDIERDGGLRCFCGVVEIEPVDLLLEIEGAFVDSAMDGVIAFALASGV